MRIERGRSVSSAGCIFESSGSSSARIAISAARIMWSRTRPRGGRRGVPQPARGARVARTQGATRGPGVVDETTKYATFRRLPPCATARTRARPPRPGARAQALLTERELCLAPRHADLRREAEEQALRRELHDRAREHAARRQVLRGPCDRALVRGRALVDRPVGVHVDRRLVLGPTRLRPALEGGARV